jgi:hypothetical protein
MSAPTLGNLGNTKARVATQRPLRSSRERLLGVYWEFGEDSSGIKFQIANPNLHRSLSETWLVFPVIFPKPDVPGFEPAMLIW